MADAIRSFKQNVNASGPNGNTALMYVSTPEWAAKLKANGAKLDAVNKDGQTALIVHVIEGNDAVVCKLLKLGADPTVKDASGCDALYYANELSKADDSEKLSSATITQIKRCAAQRATANRRKTI